MKICFTYAALGALNENIVQTHLNIALLKVFQYLNGRYIAYFYLSNEKILGIETYLFENCSPKKGSPKF